MKNINLKKFIAATLVLLPLLIIFDIVYDKLFKELDFNETFAMKNLFFKIAAALVGAYFYASSKKNKEE
ncbi:MAG: hypothetical protein KF781_01310 [Chitinophagaceae bacterium]|nr:hypothetical protein [Chitinophagaceae bacterium]MCW5905373.1 hypothetical protein [Chitinophagaceae bacterium]